MKPFAASCNLGSMDRHQDSFHIEDVHFDLEIEFNDQHLFLCFTYLPANCEVALLMNTVSTSKSNMVDALVQAMVWLELKQLCAQLVLYTV